MKVNIVQYTRMAPVDGVPAPVGEHKLGGQTLTADGDFAALTADTRFIRVATDTQVYFKRNKLGVAAASTDLLLPAGRVEFFAVWGGETPTITSA